ncbi:MAG TPA: polysaccharide deacetylase, partial [Polyangiaceae bacterium]|nr:polysaccharide deacetylase [Polyangiaceae bacterium]
IELPVQVTRGLRLPFIGTSLTLGGERTARALTRMVVGEPVVNLELHGMDVLDAGDGLDALRGHQPDVRLEQAHKVRILGSVFELLRSEGYRFVTLEDAARQVAERIDAQR